MLIGAAGMLANTKISRALARILPFLTYGLPRNLEILVGHFDPYLDFDAFDRGEQHVCACTCASNEYVGFCCSARVCQRPSQDVFLNDTLFRPDIRTYH
jgi:hypothetical protein